tara:strand:- start:32 stop:1012 length:981 start_codon:yes stop_codon:yes gene_type:complete
MSIDRKIDYVEQDGYKNYTKNSDSVTVPRKFKSRKDATPTKLAYITDAEAKQLKKQNPGTPHKGPSGIPSYDDYDAKTGSFRSGAAMSAAETGGKTERDRRDLRAAGIGPQEAQDLRSAAINAGAGQTVNRGWFEPKYNQTVGVEDIAAAKAFRNDPNNRFAKQAYRNTRGSRFGIGSLLGGLAGLIMGIPGLGLGINALTNLPKHDTLSDWWNSRKTWSGDDEDNEIILSNFQRNPETGKYEYVKRENPEYYNDLDNEFALGTISDPYSMTVGTTTPINTVDGILNTDAFANNRKNFNINNANLYQTTDDGQMYIDEEIASRRFP